jgi:hypothetical protein
MRRAVGGTGDHRPEEIQKREVQQIEPERRSGEKPDQALHRRCRHRQPSVCKTHDKEGNERAEM